MITYTDSTFFACQLDESTNVSNLSQLLVYNRYVADKKTKKEFLFCQLLETTSKAADFFQVMFDILTKLD